MNKNEYSTESCHLFVINQFEFSEEERYFQSHVPPPRRDYVSLHLDSGSIPNTIFGMFYIPNIF